MSLGLNKVNTEVLELSVEELSICVGPRLVNRTPSFSLIHCREGEGMPNE